MDNTGGQFGQEYPLNSKSRIYKINKKIHQMEKLKAQCYILFFLTTTVYSWGQSNKLNMGIEGGPSSIFLIENNSNSTPLKTKPNNIGYSGGLFLQYKVNNLLTIRTSISYERKGNKETFDSLSYTGSTIISTIQKNTNLDYLIMPILVRANFGRQIQFFINGGPYLAYLIKQATVIKLNNVPKQEFNLQYGFKFDYGISTGMGLSFPINEQFSASLEVRNNLGLRNLDNYERSKTNSTNILLGLNYHFTKFKKRRNWHYN